MQAIIFTMLLSIPIFCRSGSHITRGITFYLITTIKVVCRVGSLSDAFNFFTK